VTAPFSLIGRLFRRRGDLRQAGKKIKAAVLRVNPQEEQIKTSSLALRNILQSLSVVIQRTDQAASTSNQTLGDVRNSIGQMEFPNDLSEDHKLLMREIDRVISGNTVLKQELSRSQDILASQRRQIEELRAAVRLDSLTQLANRAYFDEKLVEMINLRRRYKDIFSILLVDVDNFKGINDRFGHQAGDRIIKGVAFNLRAALRESDVVARFGGDEFAILLYRSNARSAVEVAHKLCHAQRESRFLLDGANINVTLSIGVAEANDEDTAETLLKRVDQALYRVKSEGRNGVRCQ
jgi:diguanylate cyclase